MCDPADDQCEGRAGGWLVIAAWIVLAAVGIGLYAAIVLLFGAWWMLVTILLVALAGAICMWNVEREERRRYAGGSDRDWE